MPHTSRRKRASVPAQKRLQVTDDDGWTHVTSGSNVRRAMRTAQQVPSDDKDTQAQEPTLGPAEAPARLTFEELQTQYAAHRSRWVDSETWKTLTRHLIEQMAERERIVSQDEGPVRGPVDAIVCIGLGSPSGFLRDGWVDRRSVSMYQLAALDCIAKQLSSSSRLVLFTSSPV